MCGLCGTFAPAGDPDRTVAAAMHAKLAHRGPDEAYSLSTPKLSVKLGRLGMTGLRDGWQPAEDRSGRYAAMTNGEVYNHRDLRARLGERALPNGVDVAIVPELFARYGPAGLELIDGQFATAVYDRAEERLFLGRDRFGICPLYYTVHGSLVHFCSELKPLVTSVPVDWRLDITAVDQYLTLGNIVAPRTLVRDVHAVPPGSMVRFGGGGAPETLRYWRYGEFGTGESEAEVAAEQIRDTLQGAVRDRLAADVEIGAYLSGGFDSTTLVVEAARILGKAPKTYSVLFEQDAALDEGRFQREVSEAVGSEHHQIRCAPAHVAAEFEDMVRHCCYPQRETYNVAALMLSREVRQTGLKGVISGEGADELFFGYDSYAFDSARRRPPAGRPENEQAWGRADFGWEVDWAKAARRREASLAPWAAEALAGREFWRDRLIPFGDAELAGLSPARLRSIADVYVQLSGHLLGDHGDTMLMANSVEGRYPFLGNAVVALAQRIGDAEKVADFEGKACLKAAYTGIVPQQVLRRAKQGFTAYGLADAADGRTFAGWRDLVAASGVFRADALAALAADRSADKWDVRVSVISISMIIDELGLKP